jgi:hypothetical protein
MIIEMLFVVFMAVWFLTCLPVPQFSAYPWASNWLAFICVLMVGLYLFIPALRG